MSFSQSNKNVLSLVKSIAVPLLVGTAASLLTRQSMQLFEELNKPPLSPPAIVFPIVWTILYTLMGISYYLIISSGGNEEDVRSATRIYWFQLIVNFLWPTFFFNFEWYLFSFIWLIILWVLVLLMIIKFSTISKVAAWINVPYLIWLTFAAYLNLGYIYIELIKGTG